MRNSCIALLLLSLLSGCSRSEAPDNSPDQISLVTTGVVSTLNLKTVTCSSQDLLIGIPLDFVVHSDTKELFRAIPDKQGGRDIFPLGFRFYERYPNESEPRPDGPKDRIVEVVFGDIRVKTQIGQTLSESAFTRVHTCITRLRNDLWVVATLSTNLGDKRFSAADLAAIVKSIAEKSNK